jgi:hypothetical protein
MKIIFLFLLLITTAVVKPLTSITPAFGGGATVWHSGGGITNITPSFGVGCTIWHPNGGITSVTPNFGGGYTIWD